LQEQVASVIFQYTANQLKMYRMMHKKWNIQMSLNHCSEGCSYGTLYSRDTRSQKQLISTTTNV